MSDEMLSYHAQDFYALLEVSHDATRDEIEAAYERLKGVFDTSSSATYMLFGDDEAQAMRQMLEEAYQTLTDDQERERYDDKLGIQRTSKARPTHTTSVTSSTSPIVTAAIVDDADVVSTDTQETKAPRRVDASLTQAAPSAPSFVPPAVAEPLTEKLPVLSGPSAREDENMEYSGGVLMRLRESKGVTLEAIAQRTKISLTHLRAIEANIYDKLPARVYVRGFVAQYAKFLNLNADRVCASYLAIYDRFVQAKTAP